MPRVWVFFRSHWLRNAVREPGKRRRRPAPKQEPILRSRGTTPEARFATAMFPFFKLTTVRRLLSEKATHVNTRDEDEYTPLHRAAYSGHLDVVRELIAQGADVHAVTVDGWTPLHSACKWNNTRVASFLLQHDADINAQTKGLLTPLHLAAGNRDSKDTLELLLMNRYIKPGLKNNLEETAFDIARRTSVYHYLFEIVEGCTNSSPQP
ncbi:ankyrin repeat domain-containing protein 49 isoform X2 [Neovison vison]|uniref:ankyrin repeat domain-containing protein 49 isoform X2 n=1 Tax=Neovison vison TaxID=452646 RepID=UPI001CF0B1F4|nr:ankyrin repeat domain-containing protein 49 isoform X2 [Neogale vison]